MVNLRSLLLAASAFLLTGPVHAHGAIFLPSKASNYAFTNRLAGLSGAASASALQAKLITGAGINLGVTQQIRSAILNSGQLNGTLYQNGGGNVYSTFPNFVLAFGSNPLSKMGLGGTTVPSTLPNFFSPIGFRTRLHNTGGGGTGIGGGIGYNAHLSATQSQLHSLALGSVAAGQKLGTQILSSPVVGGNIFGTDYFQSTFTSPFRFNRNQNFDFAFGNNPLNTNGTGLATFNAAGVGNYVLLANGARLNFSGGRILATVYEGGSPAGGGIFAFGNSKFSFPNNFSSAPTLVSFEKYPSTIFRISSILLPHHL